MKKRWAALMICFLLLGCAPAGLGAQTDAALPVLVEGGAWGEGAGHVQGIACDDTREYLYFSFTDRLIKVDMRTGQVAASVKGLQTGGYDAHLGCLAYYRGKIYGSLEYKANAQFYIAVFDCAAITEMDMDCAAPGVMQALYMDEAVKDYTDGLAAGEHDNARSSLGHRYGCSGIDGVTFGTLPGEPDGKTYLLVAYGVYLNNSRQDNDYQVILAFDADTLAPQPFDPRQEHQTGPALADKLFVYTGNTDYGVQNLEFDRDTGDLWMICMAGQKPQFPNCPIYLADGGVRALEQPLQIAGAGYETPVMGRVLQLKSGAGVYDQDSGVWGIPAKPYSAEMGFISLGDDLFYVAYGGWRDKKHFADAYLVRLDRGAWTFRWVNYEIMDEYVRRVVSAGRTKADVEALRQYYTKWSWRMAPYDAVGAEAPKWLKRHKKDRTDAGVAISGYVKQKKKDHLWEACARQLGLEAAGEAALREGYPEALEDGSKCSDGMMLAQMQVWLLTAEANQQAAVADGRNILLEAVENKRDYSYPAQDLIQELTGRIQGVGKINRGNVEEKYREIAAIMEEVIAWATDGQPDLLKEKIVPLLQPPER